MRDVLDAFHQPDEHLVLIGPARGETDAAIAHYDGRHAMGRRRDEPILPGDLAVVVGVEVDESGGDDPALRVDLVCANSPAIR